ncbi:MAG: hypothetical protein CMM15_10325 [Rhodospirillaceae bacterium]|nr:hypothetical protein [Rhodospirillaceae bacterium]OUX67961.1 MAG: hypothetical protein CBD38_00655 [bacterium TMED178]|tara:strand:+ start:450 stop:1124 length:675 start_codon:yes stop_codon:yes gene_type:complete
MEQFYAGFVSGVFQTVIGHPFDTLKVWSQNYAKLKPPKTTLTNLFKGVHYPLLQAPFLTGISFGVYGKIYEKTKNTYIAGSFTGVVSSVVDTPIDFYKIESQQQKTTINNSWLYSFRFWHVVLMRAVPSCALYYSTYHNMRELEVPILFSGGIAGLCSWTLTYPLDTIKTKIQTGLTTSIRQAIEEGNLWKGLSFAAIRAVIANAVGFYVYEQTLRLQTDQYSK